jgi:alpha-glucuronidase
VRNVGWDPQNPNWTGHPLAAANTYAYGRLAWDPSADPAQLADEWARMTFGDDPEVVRVTKDLLMRSDKVFESYNSPLGAGFICEGWRSHFDPLPEGMHYRFHKSDANGIGFDRVSSGYLDQYPPEVQELYRDPKTCPDELLLFFHRVPWNHVLHSGKTVIEHIYDSRFEGIQEVEKMREDWKSLEGRMPEGKYEEILKKFDEQVEHAKFWRDALAAYFLDVSGIQDTERQWLGIRRIHPPGEDGMMHVSVVNNGPEPLEVTVRVSSHGVEGSKTITVPPTAKPGPVDVAVPVSVADVDGTPQVEITAKRPGGEAADVLGPRVPMIITDSSDLEPWMAKEHVKPQ